MRKLIEELRQMLAEKKHGVPELQCPADCTHDRIAAAAEKDLGSVEAGGNHDTVRDRCGKVVSQIPRHNHLNPNTCRDIIKKLKAAMKDDDVCEPGGVHEGVSKILYHRTSLDALDAITATNTIRMATSAGTASDDTFHKNRTRLYYLSTSRNKSAGYSGPVTLVLDGEALGSRLKGGAVDYWGREMRKANPANNEMEDRLYGSEAEIKNALKYVKEIHVLHQPDRYNENYRDGYYKQMRRVFIAAKKAGIPIHGYKDEKAYKILNVQKAVPFDEKDFETPPGEYEKPWTGRGGRSNNHFMDGVVELYHKKVTDKLSDQAKSVLRSIRYHDAHSGLEADLHNDKKKPSVDNLVQILQKERMDVKGFIAALNQKWNVDREGKTEPNLLPDAYRAKYGFCPDGWHWNGTHCRPVKK